LSALPAQAAPEKVPYQQSAQAPSCYGNLYCLITFPATTAQTEIHNVSCWTVVSEGAVVQQLSFYFTNPSVDPTNLLMPIFSQGPNGPGLTTGSNLQTLLFVEEGVTPTVFFQLDSGGVTYLTCTISGYALKR
jgi:hypothetical protein